MKQNSFADDMRSTANICIERFKGRFPGLDLTVKSLTVIDEILEEASDVIDSIPEPSKKQLIEQIGAYIFEVARSNFGGKYYWYDKLDQPILVTGQPDFEISITAFEKVKGRLENGKEDNIPFYFAGYVERVASAKPGDKAFIT